MTTLYYILIALHVICWIGALALIDPVKAVIRKGATHAVTGALVTGLILVGVGEAADLRDYNHIKIALKLIIAVIATVAVFMAARKENDNASAGPVFGLVAANILIAILW